MFNSWTLIVSFLGLQILPDSFKKTVNKDTFKKATKTWKPSNCPCRLCRVCSKSLLNYNDKEHLQMC